MNRNPLLLFFIILIEGYVVLASELIAMRQLVPFVGSGMEIVAIIVSAVLLPLAIGYHKGGQNRRHIRKRLLRNILTALAFLTAGLSYPILEIFFGLVGAIGIQQPVLQAACYAMLFLVTPVYLLGQTVPLVSNYFSNRRISELTGRMLFFSTVGSFLGSVFSTLVLMNTIGVHATVIFTLGLLGLLVLLLSRKIICDMTIGALLLSALVFSLNSPASLKTFNIVSNNAYNMVSIHKNPANGDRYMNINRSASSGLSRDNKRFFDYLRYIEPIFIDPLNNPAAPAREILVLGAGGFTIGLDDQHNHYTFVDIDPDLKKVAERDFIKKRLGPNKDFIAQSARAFVHQSDKQYDFILIDTFTNVISVPMETTTREFLLDTKKLLKPQGILIVNQIARPDFSDRFSIRYDRTFASVLGLYSRQVLGTYNPWKPKGVSTYHNILYIYYARANSEDRTIYSDDLNTYSLDRTQH